MYLKNTSGQTLYFCLVNINTGAPVTGATATVRRVIDGGAQSAITGSVTEDGNGQYHINLSQADTNGNDIGFFITATNSVPVSLSIVTSLVVENSFIQNLLTFNLSAITGEAARSLINAIRTLRNRIKKDPVTGLLTVYKEDDSTTAWTANTTPDTSTNTAIKEVDPT